MLPSFATVAPTFHATEAPKVVFPGIDIDLAKVVHAGQQVSIHRPIPAPARRPRAADRRGLGQGSGGGHRRSTPPSTTGRVAVDHLSSIFASGEGGFGGERGASDKRTLPDRAPDHRIEIPTLPQQALYYRLCGDRNPLHSDPAFARKAEFPAPHPARPVHIRAVLRASSTKSAV